MEWRNEISKRFRESVQDQPYAAIRWILSLLGWWSIFIYSNVRVCPLKPLLGDIRIKLLSKISEILLQDILKCIIIEK
jgi:hypothetical protein